MKHFAIMIVLVSSLIPGSLLWGDAGGHYLSSLPLVNAVMDNKLAEAERLLAKGADPDAWDKNGQCALFLVTGPEMANLLLKYHADPNLTDSQGTTALMRIKDISVARVLLEHGADAGRVDNHGQSVLHCAVIHLDDSLVKMLVKAGASVDGQDKEGKTPLFHAVGEDRARVVNALLQNGADPNIPDNNGDTPWSFASKHSMIQICDLLRPRVSKENLEKKFEITDMAKEYMIRTNQFDVLARLLKDGMDPNTRFRSVPALSLACEASSPRMVRMLLQAGADPNQKDPSGSTALFKALMANSHRLDMVQELLLAGADSDIRNNRGVLPVEFLMNCWQRETAVQAAPLLSVANQAALDEPVLDELYKAMDDKDPATLKSLLDRHPALGAALRTVLWSAVDSGSLPLVKVVVEYGVDVNETFDDVNALERASREGYPEIVRYLLDHGADPSISIHNAVTGDEETPLSVAATPAIKKMIKDALKKK